MSPASRRRGELAGLRVEDDDLKGRLACVTGKGGHVRAARFGAKAAVALDRYLRLRRTGKTLLSVWPSAVVSDPGNADLEWGDIFGPS